VYFTYFYHLGYLCAKNYQIGRDLTKFWQKQVGSFFGTPCTASAHFCCWPNCLELTAWRRSRFRMCRGYSHSLKPFLFSQH